MSCEFQLSAERDLDDSDSDIFYSDIFTMPPSSINFPAGMGQLVLIVKMS